MQTEAQIEEKDQPRLLFGNRHLTNETNVFQHNAWDDVQWDEAQEQEALKKVQQNSTIKFSEQQILEYNQGANKFWDSFYDVHDNKFFKDRHWLFTEFPELLSTNNESFSIFELGCGVGNTIFPILQLNQNPLLRVFGCDFSQKAIKILQESATFDQTRCKVFVLDITQDLWDNANLAENSLDIIVMIFVLSAVNPDKYKTIIGNCFKYLKPGGLILFRDYGRYDLAQLRFKPGRSAGENFYVRGDGTQVYFFTQEEIKILFEQGGFLEEENRADRRLQVNRGRLLKMYRVWIQAKYKKPNL